MGPMGNGGTGDMRYRGMSSRVQGYGAYWQWGTGGMGHMGNGSHGHGIQGVWGIWAMRPTGGMGTGVWAQGVWGTRGMGHVGNGIQGYGQWGPLVICSQNIKKMSSCQKDVKLSKRCQMSKNETPRLWRRFTKKLNWHNEVHTY